MSQPEMERRTVQNTNDILSIYDMLSEMNGTLARHSVQLSNIASALDAHDARFDAHDARFDAIDARLESLDANVTEILRRLTA
jgi:hypothetical protein